MLYLNREKYEFEQSKGHFLGHASSNSELCMDEVKESYIGVGGTHNGNWVKILPLTY